MTGNDVAALRMPVNGVELAVPVGSAGGIRPATMGYLTQVARSG